MVAVEIMLRTSFCAVPDFIRVEPMITSGPTSGQMATSTLPVPSGPRAELPGASLPDPAGSAFVVTSTVPAPTSRA